MSRNIEFNYCPECGGAFHPEINQRTGGRVLPVCEKCGLVFFLDPKLAAACVIEDQGRVLMVRRARPPQIGKWCLPGGFVDRGEPVEIAAKREALEETGLEVQIEGLIGLFSYVDYPVVVAIYNTVIMGGKLKSSPESTDERWFEPHEIPWEQLAFPSARDALLRWVGGQSN